MRGRADETDMIDPLHCNVLNNYVKLALVIIVFPPVINVFPLVVNVFVSLICF